MRRLGLLVAFAASAAVLAAGAAPALGLTDEIAYRCDVDICLVTPGAPNTVTNLTDNGSTSFESTPVWSPNGTKLAFISTFGNGERNLFVMDPDAQGEAINQATQLTFYPYDGNNGYLTDPVWSRDGTKIAFERTPNSQGGRAVFSVASDGTTVTPVSIAAVGQHPTWSPDGTRIAYSRGEQIWVANANGSGTPAALANGVGHDPTWSPSGTKIAFDTIDPVEHSPFVDLHVESACGTGPPIATPINFTQWTYAAWSPDGTRIAYRSTTVNDGHIRVVHADGSQDMGLASKALETDDAPSWSPDGTRVTFHGRQYSLTDPNVQKNAIYIASTTDGSGQPTAITTDGTDSHANAEPAWRPDPSRSPFVPIIDPCGPGAPGPVPGPGPPTPSGPGSTARKPTVVWITKRIPYSGGPVVNVGSYGCDGPACSVGWIGATQVRVGSPAHSIDARTAKAKLETIVVGRGHMQVPSGKTRPLKLALTHAGRTLLESRRALAIKVTVTTTGAARPKTTTTKTVHVIYVKRAKHRRKHAH